MIRLRVTRPSPTTPHRDVSPHESDFDKLFCEGKTSLENISVWEYVKLDDKKASGGIF